MYIWFRSGRYTVYQSLLIDQLEVSILISICSKKKLSDKVCKMHWSVYCTGSEYMSVLFLCILCNSFEMLCVLLFYDCVLCVCLSVDVDVCERMQVCRCAYRCVLSTWRWYQVSSLITHHHVHPHKDCHAAWSSLIRLAGLPISGRCHLFSSSTILSCSHVHAGDLKTVSSSGLHGRHSTDWAVSPLLHPIL